MTIAGLIRAGAARFSAARLVFGHGTSNATEEAAYLAAHALKVPLERLPALADTRLPRDREHAVLRLFEKRIAERKPAWNTGGSAALVLLIATCWSPQIAHKPIISRMAKLSRVRRVGRAVVLMGFAGSRS